MQHPYSEAELVEQSAIDLLTELGWETQDCHNELAEGEHSPLDRETKSEVVLTTRLESALRRLNPDVSDAAIHAVIEELTRSRTTMPDQTNWDIYSLLKDGVKVTGSDPDDEGETVETLQVIDWDNPTNNDFLLASQFTVVSEMYTRRPDAVGFVNGLPLVVMEFKRIDENLYSAYHDNICDYKDTIPHLFWYNALIILSNGTESRVGSLTASWEHFAEWKRIDSEAEPGTVSLETILRGLCDHHRLLDIIENFILFMEVQGGLIKLIAKNHQYLGVNNTIKALQNIQSNQGKLGVFWHTQGSGKSVSMIFFTQKVLRKHLGTWTFVLVTDRKELDNQLYKNFASTSGVVAPQEIHAQDIVHLRQLLRVGHRYVFTLIQKFQTQGGEPHPVLSERSDIIVITDEAHRSQYDTLALNMRTALPNAAFIAFTGTPLIAGEEKTRAVFGDYVSIYDFKQSVEDKATVPLYYENRVPRLQLTNEDLNEDLEQILEDAELDDAQEAKLERQFSKEYHLITRDERLEIVAKDIVSHFMGRGHRGKAMVISIDKATTVKMYDKVLHHWNQHLDQLRSKLSTATSAKDRAPLEKNIQYMEETDMAVVVSQAQNEIGNLRKQGVDIIPHRQRMVREDLDTKFKDPDDPFRIVFVCAMWSTGFDVPSCSTIYLDKPQRNHTLMQTIARANRVHGDKVNGLIVDYIGVFRDLEKALTIYATGVDEEGKSPIQDKSKLVEQLRDAIAEVKAFWASLGIDFAQIDAAPSMERIGLIEDARDSILTNDETKREYLQGANNVLRLYKAILPDPDASEFVAICSLICIITRKINSVTASADLSDVMTDIEHLLDQSIAPTSYLIEDPAYYETDQIVDLSQIDFDQLREQFRGRHKQTEIEKLKGSINSKLSQLIHLNRTRMNYQEKFEQMIAEYNAASDVQQFFEQLIALADELNAEEQRTITEQVSEEELALFDHLIPTELDLTEAERDKVKSTAQQLLNDLREKLVLDWRKRQQARAVVLQTIKVVLDNKLPQCYTPELYNQKCQVVYQHIYDSYFGEGRSIYQSPGGPVSQN